MNQHVNRRRRVIAALGTAALLPPLRSLAAEPPLIGYLLLQPLQPTPTPERQAFLDGLRAQGLIEGRDYRILYKSAEMETDFLEDAARELVKAGVRVIVATGGAAVSAAQKVTQSVPIVGISMTDPVPRFAKSLARPGGNITGLANLQFDLAAKRVQLLKEMVPGMRSFAVIWNAASGTRPTELAEIEAAATILKLRLIPANVRDTADLTRVFARLRRERPDAIVTVIDPHIGAYSTLIADFARAEKIPTMSGLAQFTHQGSGLLCARSCHHVSARRFFRQAHSRRHPTRQSADRAADANRIHRQPQDRARDRADRPAGHLAARGQGD